MAWKATAFYSLVCSRLLICFCNADEVYISETCPSGIPPLSSVACTQATVSCSHRLTLTFRCAVFRLCSSALLPFSYTLKLGPMSIPLRAFCRCSKRAERRSHSSTSNRSCLKRGVVLLYKYAQRFREGEYSSAQQKCHPDHN